MLNETNASQLRIVQVSVGLEEEYSVWCKGLARGRRERERERVTKRAESG